MTFLSPIALLLLIPYAGVVAWVLMGRPDFRRVSTTQFWDRTDTTAQARRGFHKPPLAYVLLLIAMLAGILAASGLAAKLSFRAETFTLIIDRALPSAVALRLDPDLRFRAVPSNAGSVGVVLVPEGSIENEDSNGTVLLLRDLRPTAADTSAALDAIIRRELARTDQPIRVVTTQAVNVSDPRVSVIAPEKRLENAAIESFAIVDAPKPQAMVRVRNGTAKAQATLRVDSAEQVIALPPTGESKDYFVDLPSVGEYAVAILGIDDDIRADNRAYLARVGAWPRVEARSALPPGVGKVIGIYTSQRPASPGAAVVTIGGDAGASIILAPATTAPQGEVRAAPHAVTRDLDWASLLRNVRIATQPTPGTPLVTVGEQAVVVEAADRSLWIGFDLDAIAQRAEFVIFLTRAIDHVAGARQTYTSEPTRPADGSWTRLAPSDPDDLDAAPGVFRTPEGLRALNIGPQMTSFSPVSVAPAPVGGHMIRLASPLGVGASLIALWGMIRLTRI